MTARMILLPLAAAAALTACTTELAGPSAAVPEIGVTQWRTIATKDDRHRLSNWRKIWVKALDQARPRHRSQIAGEGPLLDPDAALLEPSPPPGDYRCRTIKLGAKGAGIPPYVAYPPFRCRIAKEGDGTLSFAKTDGQQRPVGRIFPESSRRMVFLGTLQLGDEPGTLRYGLDKDRDVAALVERIGPRRWRLAFPSPHFESTLDVIELVPAG